MAVQRQRHHQPDHLLGWQTPIADAGCFSALHSLFDPLERQVLAAMRQAANDTIEETSNWSSASRTILDEALKAAGIISLSEIAPRYASGYKSILNRGKIRSETEYYLVNGILVDQGNEISGEERARLQELIYA